MNNNKFSWYIADKHYINYLRKFDNKVEKIDYVDKVKPYIGILLSINNLDYYVPISSVKKKHYKLKEQIDFIKIINNDKLLGVLNINNMVPISSKNVINLKYDEISNYREFFSKEDQKLYVELLSIELNLINKKKEKIKENANKVYNIKINNPSSNIAKRCCDFILLEKKCIEYNQLKFSF